MIRTILSSLRIIFYLFILVLVYVFYLSRDLPSLERLETFDPAMLSTLYDRNGEVIYWTNDWEHPPIINFDPPIILFEGQGLKLKATYDNWTSRPITFGFKSTDEMMILFGWYY